MAATDADVTMSNSSITDGTARIHDWVDQLSVCGAEARSSSQCDQTLDVERVIAAGQPSTSTLESCSHVGSQVQNISFQASVGDHDYPHDRSRSDAFYAVDGDESRSDALGVMQNVSSISSSRQKVVGTQSSASEEHRIVSSVSKACRCCRYIAAHGP